LTIDPVEDLMPDINPYHYCRNNPINLIDVMGLIPGHPDWDIEPIEVTSERYDPFDEVRKRIIRRQINDIMKKNDKSNEKDNYKSNFAFYSYLFGSTSTGVGFLGENFIDIKNRYLLKKVLFDTKWTPKLYNTFKPLLSQKTLVLGKVFKYGGTVLSVAGLTYTAIGIFSGEYSKGGYWGKFNAYLDIGIGGMAFIPGAGWALSGGSALVKDVIAPGYAKEAINYMEHGYNPGLLYTSWQK
jgi:hypothetical protein